MGAYKNPPEHPERGGVRPDHEDGIRNTDRYCTARVVRQVAAESTDSSASSARGVVLSNAYSIATIWRIMNYDSVANRTQDAPT